MSRLSLGSQVRHALPPDTRNVITNYDSVKTDLAEYGIQFMPIKNSTTIPRDGFNFVLFNGYWFEVKNPISEHERCNIVKSDKTHHLSSYLCSYCHDEDCRLEFVKTHNPNSYRYSDSIHLNSDTHLMLVKLLANLLQTNGVNLTNVQEPEPEHVLIDQKKKTATTTTARKKTISITTKRKVWEQCFEKLGTAVCPVCTISEITPFTFHCGHIISEFNGGPATSDNLTAICATCNLSMGSMDYAEYIMTRT
jgi:hypothetical protein